MAADQGLAAMKYVVSSENFYVSDSWIFLDSFMSGMDFLSTYNFFVASCITILKDTCLLWYVQSPAKET